MVSGRRRQLLKTGTDRWIIIIIIIIIIIKLTTNEFYWTYISNYNAVVYIHRPYYIIKTQFAEFYSADVDKFVSGVL